MSRRRLRILFVLPFPPQLRGRHGGARVTGQLIAALAGRHDVAVVHLAEAGDAPMEEELRSRCALVERVERPAGTRLATALRVKAGLLRGVPTWASELDAPGLSDRLAAVAASWRPEIVQVEYPAMGRYLAALDWCAAPRVLVEHDASLRDLRDFGPVVGALDARAWRRFERGVMRRVQAVVVFTERDRMSLESLEAGTRVVRIPFGVAFPDGQARVEPAARRARGREVVFVGSFRHAANADAAIWLAGELFPRVRAAVPDARLTIVGESPPPELSALASEGVAVTGPVEDVAPYLVRAAIVAAPIRIGGGMRVKVLEALAAGRPLVATPLAVEGLDVTDGVQVELASTEAEFAAALERLLRDERSREALGRRARAWAHAELGWERVVARYERLYDELRGALPEVASGRRSLLELLLPRGRATRPLVLGSGCPAHLLPASAAPAGARPAAAGAGGGQRCDLAIVAPLPHQATRDWLETAVERCTAALEPHGVLYALVPRAARRRLRRLLRAHGLVLEPALLHLPATAEARQLIPLDARAARESFASVVPLVWWKRAALRVVFAAGGRWLLAAKLPDVALVARRPGARPLVAWLWGHAPPTMATQRAAIAAGWASSAAKVVVHEVAGAGDDAVVAKLSLEPAERVSSEAEVLAELGPDAARAGAAVPEPVTSFDLDGLPVLVESRVDGRLAAPELMRRKRRLEPVLTQVADWLERWQAATAREQTLAREQLERELLAPAEAVARELPNGSSYVAALRELCVHLEGARAPLVDSHNDLTMWNVLIGPRRRLAVVDWEAGERATLPMKDFFYMAADAVAATGGYRDRPSAVADCFSPGGAHAALITGRRARMESLLGVPPGLADICFYACWLGHAANEQRAAKPGDERPFLAIVERLASTLAP